MATKVARAAPCSWPPRSGVTSKQVDAVCWGGRPDVTHARPSSVAPLTSPALGSPRPGPSRLPARGQRPGPSDHGLAAPSRPPVPHLERARPCLLRVAVIVARVLIARIICLVIFAVLLALVLPGGIAVRVVHPPPARPAFRGKESERGGNAGAGRRQVPPTAQFPPLRGVPSMAAMLELGGKPRSPGLGSAPEGQQSPEAVHRGFSSRSSRQSFHLPGD